MVRTARLLIALSMVTARSMVAVLVQIANEIGGILEQHKAQSIHDIQEVRANYQNTIQSNPNRAWDLFKLCRGECKVIPSEIRTSWLPSDIAALPEYAEQESKWRAEIEAAKAALEDLKF